MFFGYDITNENWQVIGAINMGHSYYARHDWRAPGDRAWMDTWQRVCTDCGEKVPDNVQTILCLLRGTM